MPTYLLTWNPKHFTSGGDGSENQTLAYETGDEVRWSCNSQHPQINDKIYLIRLGTHQHPKGIIASGSVTQTYFQDEHWSDSNKQTGYIKFHIDELRVSSNMK